MKIRNITPLIQGVLVFLLREKADEATAGDRLLEELIAKNTPLTRSYLTEIYRRGTLQPAGSCGEMIETAREAILPLQRLFNVLFKCSLSLTLIENPTTIRIQATLILDRTLKKRIKKMLLYWQGLTSPLPEKTPLSMVRALLVLI